MALRTPVQATKRHAGTIKTAFHSQGHQRCRATHQLCRLQYLEPQEAPHFSQAIISVTVQLWIYVFWVISVYLNIRNTLPKSGTFLLGHPVYMCLCVCVCVSKWFGCFGHASVFLVRRAPQTAHNSSPWHFLPGSIVFETSWRFNSLTNSK